MNFVDVSPIALTMFAQAVEQNPNVQVLGTMERGDHVCRFVIVVHGYEGPPCQWACEVTIDGGQTITRFRALDQ